MGVGTAEPEELWRAHDSRASGFGRLAQAILLQKETASKPNSRSRRVSPVGPVEGGARTSLNCPSASPRRMLYRKVFVLAHFGSWRREARLTLVSVRNINLRSCQGTQSKRQCKQLRNSPFEPDCPQHRRGSLIS